MHMHGGVGETGTACTLFYPCSPKADLNWCLSWILCLFYFFKHVYVYVSENSQRDRKRAGAGVPGSCALPDLGIRN